MVPTADPKLRGGRRVDLLFGMNVFALDGPLDGHRVAIEWGFPIYQWLKGPQLELDRQLSVSWNWTF